MPVERRRIDGQRPRRPVVDADLRIGMKTDVDHRLRADQVRGFGSSGLHVDRVDLAAHERGRFGRVEPAARQARGMAEGRVARRRCRHRCAQVRRGHVDPFDVGGPVRRATARRSRAAPPRGRCRCARRAARQADAAPAQVLRPLQAAFRQRDDRLRLVDPGQRDHARVGAGRARPQRGNAAALPECVVERMIDVRMMQCRVLALLQRAHGDAVAGEFAVEPAEMRGDAERRRHRTACTRSTGRWRKP